MTAHWKILGWPRALLIAASLALIVVALLFDLPAVFGPENQALHNAVILGSWIFAGAILLVVLIALIAMIWMNSVVERNATETLARLERLGTRWTSPAAERAREALRARSRQ